MTLTPGCEIWWSSFSLGLNYPPPKAVPSHSPCGTSSACLAGSRSGNEVLLGAKTYLGQAPHQDNTVSQHKFLTISLLDPLPDLGNLHLPVAVG